MPELDWLSGRTVEEQPLASASLSTVMGWINTCQDEHPLCWRDGLCDSSLPTRVLDVGTEGDSIVHLHASSSGERSQFVYLSFIWGTSQPANLATSENLHSLMAGIPVDSLSEIHRGAVKATRRLGLRYLWIDSHCIIQDSLDDMEIETPRMSEYVSNAAFVLQVAASPNVNATGGLFQPRPPPLLHMDIIRVKEHEDIASDTEPNISTGVDLRLPLQTAPEALGVRVMKRGWMYQEIILAKRMLIFGADQIYWHCQTGLMSEGDTLIHEPMLKLLPMSSALSEFDKRESLDSWYQLLSDYSASHLGFVTDRIVAMASFARYFDADHAFVAGLWTQELRNGLLWRVDDLRAASTAKVAATNDIAASWSWASIDGRVQYDFLRGARHDFAARQSIVTDLYIDYECTYRIDWKSSMSSLELEAMVCEAQVSRFGEECICFFDDMKWDIDWRDSKTFLFVLICPWTANPAGEIKQACGLGLIVRLLEGHVDNAFTRCGLFFGTAYDEKLEGWTRRRLRIN